MTRKSRSSSLSSSPSPLFRGCFPNVSTSTVSSIVRRKSSGRLRVSSQPLFTVSNYNFLKRIASLNYGDSIWLVHWKNTNHKYAIKRLTIPLGSMETSLLKSDSFRKLSQLESEIAVCERLSQQNHSNIVPIHEVFRHSDVYYIVMNYMNGGPLMDDSVKSLSSLNPLKLWRYTRDLIAGLGHLHDIKIVHRDIKPSNCLLDHKDRLRIADFGLSVDISDQQDDTLSRSSSTPDCTSVAFTPPEIVLNAEEWSGFAEDVYAAGVTIFIMAFGRLPFKGDTVQLLQEIAYSEVEFPSEVDPLLVDLLKGMMNKDPCKRISIGEIKCHPFITKNGSSPFAGTKQIYHASPATSSNTNHETKTLGLFVPECLKHELSEAESSLGFSEFSSELTVEYHETHSEFE
ncbi:hypothetical protein P9112_013148 [Eukaryota sp. TZLM1-RC]